MVCSESLVMTVTFVGLFTTSVSCGVLLRACAMKGSKAAKKSIAIFIFLLFLDVLDRV